MERDTNELGALAKYKREAIGREGMTAETVNSIKEALTPLMEKLGATGEYAWQFAVRQQYVEAAQYGAWVLVLVVWIGAFWWGRGRLWQSAAKAEDELQREEKDFEKRMATEWSRSKRAADLRDEVQNRKDWATGFSVGVYAMSVILTLPIVMLFINMIGRLANPEWYALKMLLDAVTGGKG